MIKFVLKKLLNYFGKKSKCSMSFIDILHTITYKLLGFTTSVGERLLFYFFIDERKLSISEFSTMIRTLVIEK